MHDSAGVFDFAAIGELAETTTQLLALGIAAHDGQSSQSGKRTQAHAQVTQYVMQQARDYLSEVREGFVLSVRASQVTDRAELGYLLERVLTDWGALSVELGLDEGDADPAALPDHESKIEHVRRQLLAFGMAATALGFLPRVPADRVTFPYSYNKPPTYADIAPPDSPGAMLWRIDEVEQTVWQVMSADMSALVKKRYGALRRTYGFFEASALLANQEAARFGVKRKKRNITLL